MSPPLSVAFLNSITVAEGLPRLQNSRLLVTSLMSISSAKQGGLDHLLCVVKNSAHCVYNIRTKLSIQLIVYSVQHVEVFQIQTDTPADLISSAPGNHLIVTNLNNPRLPKAFFTFTFV